MQPLMVASNKCNLIRLTHSLKHIHSPVGIGDMVDSRKLSQRQRPKIQERFKEFTNYLNKKYSKDVRRSGICLENFYKLLGESNDGEKTCHNSPVTTNFCCGLNYS